MPTQIESYPHAKRIRDKIIPMIVTPKEYFDTEFLYTIEINSGIRKTYEQLERGVSFLDIFMSNRNVLRKKVLSLALNHKNNNGDLLGILEKRFFVWSYPPLDSSGQQSEFQFIYTIDQYNQAKANIENGKCGILDIPESYEVIAHDTLRLITLPSLNLPETADWITTAAKYLLGHHPDYPQETVSVRQIRTDLLIPA